VRAYGLVDPLAAPLRPRGNSAGGIGSPAGSGIIVASSVYSSFADLGGNGGGSKHSDRGGGDVAMTEIRRSSSIAPPSPPPGSKSDQASPSTPNPVASRWDMVRGSVRARGSVVNLTGSGTGGAMDRQSSLPSLFGLVGGGGAKSRPSPAHRVTTADQMYGVRESTGVDAATVSHRPRGQLPTFRQAFSRP